MKVFLYVLGFLSKTYFGEFDLLFEFLSTKLTDVDVCSNFMMGLLKAI